MRAALTVEDVELGGVRAERYRPRRSPSGTILYLHGGGFVTGSVKKARRFAAAQAAASNRDTFSIEYRLAPMHQFPAALDDVVSAYRVVLRRGADPATTVFFGGSAGACLALSALLKIRDLQLPYPAGAVLLWPYADFTFSGETILTNGDVDMLPVRDLAHIWGPAYVGDADPLDPFVSPARGLDRAPPTVGDRRWCRVVALVCRATRGECASSAAVDTQFTVYPERVHHWMMLSGLPSTAEAADEINAWIAARLGQSREKSSRPTSRNGTTRYTAMPK